MTREEFIEISKTALAPALKGRRRPDGSVKIFYSKGGPSFKGDDFRHLVQPMTRQLREHIENCVLEKYQQAIG